MNIKIITFFSFIIIQMFLVGTSSAQSLQNNYCPDLKYPQTLGSRDKNNKGETTKLQKFLKTHLNLSDQQFIVTGYFGRITQNFVKQFQRDNGLIVTGIVGFVTRQKIASLCTTQTSISEQGIQAVGQPGELCLFNGQQVASGESVAAFKESSVPFGTSCVSEFRQCNNGILSGNFTNTSCNLAPLGQ